MAMHTSYRFEVKSNPANFQGAARVENRIHNDEAHAAVLAKNAQFVSCSSLLPKASRLKKAMGRADWESHLDSGNPVREQKALAMDLVFARKALLLVRRDELKKLLVFEQQKYAAELARQGLAITKNRL
jgi:hypothetical protein